MLNQMMSHDNLWRAAKHIQRSNGAPGVDGMTVTSLIPFLKKEEKHLRQTVLSETYRPSRLRRVEIPKSSGGTRTISIATVKDRMLQQAAVQILTPIYEPIFSNSSYGYRPGRDAKKAILQCTEYANRDGLFYAAHLDIESFFDTVDHNILFSILRRHIRDKKMLRFLRIVVESGAEPKTGKGIAQGSPLSPLMANVLMNEFDQWMERCRCPFVRYADDSMLFYRT